MPLSRRLILIAVVCGFSVCASCHKKDHVVRNSDGIVPDAYIRSVVDPLADDQVKSVTIAKINFYDLQIKPEFGREKRGPAYRGMSMDVQDRATISKILDCLRMATIYAGPPTDARFVLMSLNFRDKTLGDNGVTTVNFHDDEDHEFWKILHAITTKVKTK